MIALSCFGFFLCGVLVGYLIGSYRLPLPSGPVRLVFLVGPDEEEVTMLNLKDTEQVSLSVVAKDAKGAAAQVENAVFSVSDPSLGSLEVDPSDPTKAVFKAGTPGSGQVSFSADPVGPNDAPLVAQLDVTVLPGDAVVLEINTGEVTPQ